MNRRRFLAAAGVVVTPAMRAGSDLTKNDGRTWRAFSELERAIWVHGFQDGVQDALSVLKGTVDNDPPVVSAAEAVEKVLTTNKLTYGEISQQLTQLYDDPANILIPFVFIFPIALRKFRGDSAAKIDELLGGYRKIYGK